MVSNYLDLFTVKFILDWSKAEEESTYGISLTLRQEMKGAAFIWTNLTEKKNMFQWDASYKIIPQGHQERMRSFSFGATQRGLFSVNYLFGEANIA